MLQRALQQLKKTELKKLNLVNVKVQRAKKQVDGDKRREWRWDEECDLSLFALQLH